MATRSAERSRVSRALTAARQWLASAPARVMRALRDPLLFRELAPLVIPLALYPWLRIAAENYRHSVMFRDIHMFTYAGWCLLKGERMYDQFATPDGPLAYVIYAALDVLAGSTRDQSFRAVDNVIQFLAGASAAALLVPRRTDYSWLRRLVWAGVGGVVWLVYVLSFGFSALLQREGYYLALGSLGICLVYASPQFRPRTARWMIFAGTLLGSLMLFGKPTGVIYLGLAVMTVLLLPRDADQPLRWRIRWTGAGLATAVVTMLALVAVAGSLRGYLFWHFRFPVAVYRFLEPVSWREVLGHGDRPFLTPALLTLIGGVVAVATRALPRHALAFAIGPVLHGAAALAQMKGWSYHFVPAVGSAYLFCILALVAVWTHPSAERSWDRTRTATTVAITLFLGRELVLQVQSSPWLRPEEKHLDAGESVAPRAAGAFIREHTRSTDRVYYYGNDPVLQFVAQRRPAGPYSYVLLLNYRYALDNHGELGPTPEQRADIERIAKQVQGDLCERLLRRPAAMVFTDGAQLGGSDGVADVAAFCLELRPLLDSDYHLAYNADKIRVFLRNESGTEPDL